MAEKRYISSHIDSQLPDFVRADHPIFTSFMEAYYEFLEQDPNALYGSAKLTDIADIDDTLDLFVTRFKNQYLKNFPTNLAMNPQTGRRVDDSILIKNIKEFYANRGTEKSFNLLFQLFYNTTAELYMPKEDMLHVSSGNWSQDFIIKTTSKNQRKLTDTLGLKLNQVNERTGDIESYAIISGVHQYTGEGISLTISEFQLKDVFDLDQFKTHGIIKILNNENEILTEKILPILTDIKITDGGVGYAVGDSINFENGGLGMGAKASVSTVSNEGAITGIHISDYGTNYTEIPDVGITRLGLSAGTGAELDLTTGPIVQTRGIYLDESGFLSSKKLIDSYYYQSYSYVIKSDLTLNKFKELVKKTIHPAGMNLFSQIQIRRELRSDTPFSARIAGNVKPIIGHYTPYTCKTSANLGFNSTNIDGDNNQKYGNGYNPNSTLNNHCYGTDGGLVVLTTTNVEGFTGREFIHGEGVTTSGGNTAVVFNWSVVGNMTGGLPGGYRMGGTGFTGYLRLMNFTDGLTFSQGDIVHGSTAGFTGTINRIGHGNGTVNEWEGLHNDPDAGGSTALSLGGPSSTDDSPIYHTPEQLGEEYGRNYWVIYNHPNTRYDILSGVTFGNIDIVTLNLEEGAVREFTLGGSNTVSQSINWPYVGFTG